MANKIVYRTEDEVRDSAKIQLGFDKVEANVRQGTGQITTFNQLGFKGVIDKPDGWYLPNDCNLPAIVLETYAPGIIFAHSFAASRESNTPYTLDPLPDIRA